MKIRFLLTMAIPLLMVACDDSDESSDGGGGNSSTPVTFTASIQPEANTRITVNNGWSGITDTQMAISIDGTVKEYAVSEIGEVTSIDPFYWDNKESLTVDAWYPYNDGVKPETFTVSADQSVTENYEKSDYLEVVGATITPKKSALTFTHRTAKIACTVISEFDDAKTAQITLLNLAGVDEGTSVKATGKLTALLVPQTITAGTELMAIQTDVVGKSVYTLKEDLELKKGYLYHVEVSITAGGVDAVFSESSKWVADEEIPDAQSPDVSPDTDNNGWNGNSEPSEGSSPDVNPDSNGNGWNGDSESSEGSSLDTNPENGNAGWNGDEEIAGGSSQNTNPDNGNGKWTVDEESATATTSEPTS